jgi:hypothetical protein
LGQAADCESRREMMLLVPCSPPEMIWELAGY